MLALDPLGPSADPRSYVPIDSSEQALAALRASIDEGRSPVLLEGPSGIGKTLLLRVLAAREMDCGRQVVFSPFLHLPPEDVSRWLLHLLGRSRLGEGGLDDQLLAEVRRRGPRAMLVIVDEFQSAPEASAQRLAALAGAAGGNLLLVTSGRRGRELDALRPALSPAATISFAGPVPAHEMRTLCDALISHAELDPALRQNAASERDRIVQLACGSPALLKLELLRCAASSAIHEAIDDAKHANAAQPGAEREATPEPALPAPLPALAPAPEPRNPPLALLAPAATRRGAGAWRRAARSAASATTAALLANGRESARRAQRAQTMLRLAAARAFGDTTRTALDACDALARKLRPIATPWLERPRWTRTALPTAALAVFVAWRWSPELPVFAAAEADSRAAATIRVRVNAQPWALIRVDGVDVGPTPLSHLRLAPGPHEFEAVFADGRLLRRRIEIGPDQRSVSLR
jgi:hypothetical protein